ncbi:hypothetical protein GUJ93_ZPchr0006g41902 [Zizania palustris]|uniref:Kelch repeat-containing F-box family protein n=1 Tax=Zizania palustris TaxID=103762 RepID=A0A8J5SAZ7_ZIZPA|nr:hypothetical protein GUJ93_ZPchr0006g41902 [Zizania palustris]
MLEGQSCLISRSLPSSRKQESSLAYMTYHLLEITRNKRLSGTSCIEHDSVAAAIIKRPKSAKNHKCEPLDCQGSNEHNFSDSSTLISSIGRDNSISCLARCSRSDYGSIASLNRNFNSLVRSGDLYKERRQLGIAEHWVYFSCNVQEWEAYDPNRSRWMKLPRMPHNECFMCSDKESLAVGTELLVFGKEILSHIVLSYSILTNSWSPGVDMNAPRCLFGSASFGEKAIVAGGMDAQGRVLRSAELYNSETKRWITLPCMNKARRMCSGVFINGKFYVIGGMASNTEVLTCGEEYDLEKGKLVRKYNKKDNTWTTLGELPERPEAVNGWGIAFRGCGERLLVIGGPRVLGGGMIELHSWIPREGPLRWDMIGSKPSVNKKYCDIGFIKCHKAPILPDGLEFVSLCWNEFPEMDAFSQQTVIEVPLHLYN